MKQAFRVGIAGASSLLGQELLRVLKEREFPLSRLLTFESDEEEPDLPVVDLSGHLETTAAGEDVSAADLDFIFLAARLGLMPPSLGLILEAVRGAGVSGQAPHCVVIDLVEALSQSLGEAPVGVVSVPFLERSTRGTAALPPSPVFISLHPAAVVLSSLLLRLGARFPLRSALALVFSPASEMGPQGIDELQKQTVNLLSFQKAPHSVFGAQLAFNLLAQLGGKRAAELAAVENHLRRQLRQYSADRVPLPALRVYQVPVFYSLAISLYVETEQPQAPEALAAALAGGHIRVRRRNEPSPSQVEAAGSRNILVDTIAVDPDHPTGVWIWAAVDNIRLAAVNAVEIAESLRDRMRP
jgi:aspartate-semialdehyde dehydrogenase